jgi:hypothetical protein
MAREDAAHFQYREASMRMWRMAGTEPSLDELLDDEVMVSVMRSAGLCAEDLRALVAATAERVDRGRGELRRRPAD